MKSKKWLKSILAWSITFTLLTPISITTGALTQQKINSQESLVNSLSAENINPNTNEKINTDNSIDLSSNMSSSDLEYNKDEIVVKFKSNSNNKLLSLNTDIQTNLDSALEDQSANVTSMKKLNSSNVNLVTLDKDVNINEAIVDLKNTFPNEIEYAEPNYILKSTDVKAQWRPTDNYYSGLWGLKNSGQSVNGVVGTPGIDINVEPAWDKSTGSNSVIVAVIDTGVSVTHSDLSTNIYVNTSEIPNNNIDDDHNGYVDDYQGWDAISKTGNVSDLNGHGTHVSGTIAAKSNNYGVVGVAPNVKILPVKFLDKNAEGFLSDAIQAIEYAKSMGAKIINCSWSGPDNSQALHDTIRNTDALFVCAAGNDGVNIDLNLNQTFPASFNLQNIISVASIDNTGSLSGFSNYGVNSVDIAAPGSYILSTIPNNSFRVLSGTSMATPHVSGVAALLLSCNSNLPVKDVKANIMKTAKALPSLSGKIISGGMINAYAALNLKSYTRLGGANRIETAIKIADEARAGRVLNGVILASANNFPDALSGNVLNSKYNAPTLLVNKTAQQSAETLSYIEANASKSAQIVILGAEGVIDNSIVTYLQSKGFTNIKRLGGSDRFATNRAIVRDFAPASGTPIILSTSNGYADALSISSVSATKGYPIILVDKTLSAETIALIQSIAPSKIFITGGVGVVSTSVENFARTVTPDITRLGGSDRFETSVLIYNYFIGNSKNAVVASGLNFPDALSGSYLGSKVASPILLVSPDSTTIQRNTLTSLGIQKLYILGSEGVISQRMVDNLMN